MCTLVVVVVVDDDVVGCCCCWTGGGCVAVALTSMSVTRMDELDVSKTRRSPLLFRYES